MSGQAKVTFEDESAALRAIQQRYDQSSTAVSDSLEVQSLGKLFIFFLKKILFDTMFQDKP